MKTLDIEKIHDAGLITEEQRMNHTGRLKKKWMRCLVVIASLFFVLPLGGCIVRGMLFTGPYQPPQPLPETKLLDLHCHTAGIGAGGSGCFISRKMEMSWKLRYYLTN